MACSESNLCEIQIEIIMAFGNYKHYARLKIDNKTEDYGIYYARVTSFIHSVGINLLTTRCGG